MITDGKKICPICEHACCKEWQNLYKEVPVLGMVVKAWLTEEKGKDKQYTTWISVDYEDRGVCRGYELESGDYIEFPRSFINQHYGGNRTYEDSEDERKYFLTKFEHSHEESNGNSEDVPSLPGTV